jgi:hypothetical protein
MSKDKQYVLEGEGYVISEQHMSAPKKTITKQDENPAAIDNKDKNTAAGDNNNINKHDDNDDIDNAE